MTEPELAYYRAPGPLTRVPGSYARLLVDLPSDLAELCNVVQGVVMHPDLAGLYDLEPPSARKHEEPELRHVGQMLARIAELDSRPLAHARPAGRRVLGTCRSFATLLCGLLRFQGIPARSRCGFARYFVPGRAEDHWVCEVWDSAAERWTRVDPQVDAVQRDAFQISVDTLNVGRDDFLPGGLAWQHCRSGSSAWSDFGLSAINESGLWWVLSNSIRDIAALNKVELLPWDEWGLMLKDVGGDPYTMGTDELLAGLAPDDVSQLDRVAEHTGRSVAFDAVQLAFENDERFHVPAQVTSARSGPVDLAPLIKLR